MSHSVRMWHDPEKGILTKRRNPGTKWKRLLARTPHASPGLVFELARRGDTQDALECRALQVAGRATVRRVQQPLAHRAQFADGLVEFGGLGGEQPFIDPRLAIGREHAGHLLE